MPNRSSLRCACLPGFLLLAASIAPAADFRITGPYTHDNLSVFLLHSPGNQAGTKLLTLQEAMEQQKVAVYETGQVNQLAIETHNDFHSQVRNKLGEPPDLFDYECFYVTFDIYSETDAPGRAWSLRAPPR